MKKQIMIKVSDLSLDLHNYRIPPQTSEVDVIRALILDQERGGGSSNKLFNLISDITELGMAPHEALIVTKNDQPTSGSYVVVEGNRRLAAVKLLNDSRLTKELGIDKQVAKYRDSYTKIYQVRCVVLTRDEARIWIQRKHGSALDGRGTEGWNAVQKRRADGGDKTVALLDYVYQHTESQATRDIVMSPNYPITNLERALSGLTKAAGFKYQQEEWVHKGEPTVGPAIVTEFVNDVGEGHITVDDVYNADDIKDVVGKYLRRHGLDTGEESEKKGGSATESTGTRSKKKTSTQKKTRTRSKGASRNRTRLIPRDFTVNISQKKANTICHELKSELHLKHHPAAISVLFRVFLELSLDEFLRKKSIKVKAKDTQILAAKLRAAEEFIEKNGIMTAVELKPVRQAISNRDALGSTETLNAYVHSAHLHPEGTTLATTWDNYEPFIRSLWV